MGFSTEKIPYPLNFGLDLSNYEIFFDSDNVISDVASKLNDLKIDYIISNVSIKNQNIRHDSLQNFTKPIFIHDYSLFSYEWKNKFIGKLHDEDVEKIKEYHDLIKIDLEYNIHISSKSIITKIYHSVEDKFIFCKLMRRFFTDNPDKLVNVIVPFTSEGLNQWNQLQSEMGGLDNLGLILEIQPNLPDEVSLFDKYLF
jgi:hypothetical protein